MNSDLVPIGRTDDQSVMAISAEHVRGKIVKGKETISCLTDTLVNVTTTHCYMATSYTTVYSPMFHVCMDDVTSVVTWLFTK